MNNIIAVTVGGPAGIGPEIIIKSLNKAGLAGTSVMMVGYVRTLRHIMTTNITPQAELHVTQRACDAHFASGVISVIGEPLANPDTLTLGVVQAAVSDLAYRCIERTAALALSGEMKVIATAPLSREALHLGEHNYPRHMELLAHLTGSKEYAMVLYTNKLKVIHISTHISLRKFLGTLDDERVKAVIRVANHFPERVGIEHPCIAVAGVNPHAGEHGLFGTEEIETIAPAVEAMQTEGIDITGPYPSDTVFTQCHEGLFDMIVATCHDQEHIPLKLLGFYDKVNITAGLPFIRTSANHGTTFDIVWTGKAKSESMAVSTRLIMQISQE